MKKVISLLLLAVFSSNIAFAECNFKTDIKENPDGTRTYTKECHIKVGEMKQDLEIKDAQIVEYKKAIELKDLALTKSNQNAELWMNTTFKLQDRMNTIDELRSKNQLLYFGLGVVVTSLAVWGAGQLR